MKITQQRVRRLLNVWRKRLEIDPKWKVTITIHEREHDTPGGYRDALAFINADVATWTAPLAVNAWNIETAQDLDDTICHETLHLILEPIRTALMCAFGDRFEKMGDEMLESFNETIARALSRAYAKG